MGDWQFWYIRSTWESDYFVIEADEYDTAFFDKRSKFVHYNPKTLIINNIGFDHADIFDDLKAIQRQFHHMIRTMPASGRILSVANEPNVKATLDMGCWSQQQFLGQDQTGMLNGSAMIARNLVFSTKARKWQRCIGMSLVNIICTMH